MEAAVAFARSLGLRVEAPVVLEGGMNLVLRLDPSPVVARVSRFAHRVLAPSALAGSVGLARHLGALAVAPTAFVDAGPHVLADGRYVTLWDVAPAAAPIRPRDAGAALRALHERARSYHGELRDYDPRTFALRIADLVGGDAATELRSAAARLALPELPRQPLHGDAHIGNVLPGPKWLDFDEACRGPREWDLAALRHQPVVFGERAAEVAAAFAGYGDIDEDAVAACDPLVALFLAAWGALTIPDDPRTHRRLEWLASA